METYILFLNAAFKNKKEFENFTLKTFVTIPGIYSIKYLFENREFIVIMFNSEESVETLLDSIRTSLSYDVSKFYFLFNKKSVLDISLPPEIIMLIENEIPQESVFFIEVFHVDEINFDINEILEKIEKNGLESLSKEEKKFLDDFKN